MSFIPKIPGKTAGISRGVKSWPVWLKGALAAVGAILFVYFALGLVSDVIALTIPDRYEVKLFSWVERGSGKDDDALARARRVLAELTQVPGPRRNHYARVLLYSHG